MTLLGFKTILHKKCRSGKNPEGPAENSWVLSSKMKTNFKKSGRGPEVKTQKCMHKYYLDMY
jgi:hypothetical protein